MVVNSGCLHVREQGQIQNFKKGVRLKKIGDNMGAWHSKFIGIPNVFDVAPTLYKYYFTFNISQCSASKREELH